jgi:hypothetical protein
MSSFSEERSISQLLGDSLAELAKLVQNEADLARAELREKVEIAGSAVKLIAAGAILLIPALVLLLFAVASGLIAMGLSAPLAYLLTGFATAIIAGAVIWIGVGRLSGDALKPFATLEEIRRDQAVAKELIR